MITQDHLGHPFTLKQTPKRIVSLVPSITELLYDLGLDDRIVGRTKFCVFPENAFAKAKIIGGTKNVHVDQVRALNPDLVIANKEENVKDQVDQISTFSQTFTTVIKNRADALQMIDDIGQITKTHGEAKKLTDTFNKEFAKVETLPHISMAYLIWKDPYMTVGGDTFISNYLADFGFVNVFKDMDRYPEVSLSEIEKIKPNCILLSSEPYPFAHKHKEAIMQQTGIETVLIDGSYCSWYGSRMINSVNYLRQISNKLELKGVPHP